MSLLTGWLCWSVCFVVIVQAQTANDGDLRLTGGADSTEGRLEVFYQGTWGTVCDDGFGPEAVGVACWQLGFSRHDNNYSTIGVDTSNPPILLDDISCMGMENRLDRCRHRTWGLNDCKDEEHIAVSCQVDPCRNSSCQHGATCEALDEVNTVCHCSPVTTGQLCETYINFCEVQNGGCSHQCINQIGSYVCACPTEEGLQLSSDGHSCYAPTVEVRCGRTMEVAFPRRNWPGLHEQYLGLSNGSCVAGGNATHITLSVPLFGCGTVTQKVSDGFIFKNQVMTRDVPVGGLVSRVRDVNMTVRCHYDEEMLLDNWYIVNNGQIRFSDVQQGHYQLNMDLFHNGQQYVDGQLGKLEPGEDLSIKFSLSSNDSSLQVFARNCKATSAQDSAASQYLFLDDGCGKDPHFLDNKTSSTQETLQLQAFQFLSDNSSALLVHCDVIVCNISDPANRCTQGCLTHESDQGFADDDDVDVFRKKRELDLELTRSAAASTIHLSWIAKALCMQAVFTAMWFISVF